MEKFKVGMMVRDLLPSLGYGKVVRVCKRTLWVKFIGHEDKTIYDEEHTQFLEIL